MRRPLFPAALAALCLLAACSPDRAGDEPERIPAYRSEILRDIPTIPQSLLTDTAGSADAERASYLVQASFDSVTRFYRRQLPALGWLVMNDQGDSVVMDLYLRKDSASVWVHAQKVGPLATEYTLLGSARIIPGAPVPRDSLR